MPLHRFPGTDGWRRRVRVGPATHRAAGVAADAHMGLSPALLKEAGPFPTSGVSEAVKAESELLELAAPRGWVADGQMPLW